MTVRCWLLSLPILGLLASGTAAQTIQVRSGEHDGFSRLVLDIGAERDFRLEGEGESRSLILDPPVDGFATGDVFRLIRRDRLAALESGEGLELRLACDCPVEATRHDGRYLIIDIRDPGEDTSPEETEADAATATEADAATVADAGTGADAGTAGETPGSAATDGASPEIAASDRPAGSAAPPAARAAPERAAARLPDMARLLSGPTAATPGAASTAATGPSFLPEPGGTGAVDLEMAAQIMAEQLARAAASGLLDTAPLRPMTDADPVWEDAEPEHAAPTPDPEPPDAGPPALPLRAETAFDAALHRTLAAEPRQARLTCPDPAVPIADWSASERFDHGLGRLRLALFDERDRLQRDAVIALARHYLHFGFGAEAAFWLDQLDAPPAELRIIAGLVDAAPGPHFPPSADPLICSEEDLLWHFLDGALGAEPLTEEVIGRLQRVTVGLPPALRDQIAPRVARRLLSDGAASAARNLRDHLARAGTLPATALLQLDLELGLTPGGPEATRAALALAMRDDGADPVTAMAQAMAFDRGLGLSIPPDRIEAAEALLREAGNGSGVASLWHETALARAAARDMPRLVDLLARGGLAEADRMRTLTALFAERAAARDTPSLYVLARLFGETWTATGSEAGRARVAAMAELRAAGLTGAADALRAGQRLLILPARPAPPSMEQDRLRAIWQGGDWPSLASAARSPHAGIAARMADADQAAGGGDALGTSDGEIVLTALSARLADSRALRAEVEALLESPAPRPAEEEE